MTRLTHILNDVSRCTGGDGESEICPQRDECARFVFRMTGEGWHHVNPPNFYKPGDLFGCAQIYPMERDDAAL